MWLTCRSGGEGGRIETGACVFIRSFGLGEVTLDRLNQCSLNTWGQDILIGQGEGTEGTLAARAVR